ncbi:MAG: DUF1501 domain-containing protein [Planctomycetales bacterium]
MWPGRSRGVPPTITQGRGGGGLPTQVRHHGLPFGGIAHQDTFDLKPDAPKEIRGEFTPIETVVPGIQIGELLPQLAVVADRYSLVRSIVGLRDEHSSYHMTTGYSMRRRNCSAALRGRRSRGFKGERMRRLLRLWTCFRRCNIVRTTVPGRVIWVSPMPG